MKIFSLFDGMSVAQQAISEIYKDYTYYASEIDEYAIAVTQSNFPNTRQWGDIKNIHPVNQLLFSRTGVGGNFNLLIGGSPCQDLSIAKKGRKGLDGERSGLFYDYVRILNQTKPKYFILENVASMSKESKDKISEVLGIQPVMINASLVSAQNRKRLFWVGAYSPLDDKYYTVAIPQPEDRNILLKDILIDGIAEREKSLVVTATYSRACPQDYFGKSNRQLIKVGEFNKGGQGDRVYSVQGKSVTLSGNGGGRGAKTGIYAVAFRNRGQGKKPELGGEKANAMTSVQTDSMVSENFLYRRLHPIETLRLQSMPDNYFDKAIYKNKPISNSQRYKMCGNAFNKEVVKHIIKQLDL